MVNALSDNIRNLEGEIKESITGVKALDEESIHEFRVCLKKTRTALNLIHFWLCNDSIRLEVYREFRPIFRHTGKVRELHIHQSLLPELSEKSGLDLHFLNKKIRYQIIRNTPSLIREATAFDQRLSPLFKRIYDQLTSGAECAQRVDAPMAFQIRLEQKIKKQLEAQPPDLHRIRRFLKQKIHVYDSFQESELLSFYLQFREEWKVLESSIGKWHDEKVFMLWLQKGLKWKRLTDEQYKTMVKLISLLRSSNGRMEKQLLRSIPKLKT